MNYWIWDYTAGHEDRDGFVHREGKNFFRVLWDRDMRAWYWQNETTGEEAGPFGMPEDAQKDAERCYEERERG